MRQRQALISRVMQLRRQHAASRPEPGGQPVAGPPDELPAREGRIAHLEKLVEGLQDSVHRESTRQSRLIAELESQLEPSAVPAALSMDARRRGL